MKSKLIAGALSVILFLILAPLADAQPFCGDANGDGFQNIGDAVYMINYVFKGGPAPLNNCCEACQNGEKRPCYDGPDGTMNVGECYAGLQTCIDGIWGPCEGQGLPSAELCNGLDDNCDGQTDEDFPLLGTPCDSDDPDLCANGIWTCSPDGSGVECSGDINVVEICDGIDNDCDGQIDEICVPGQHVTSTGCNAGECIITGCTLGYADCDGTFSNGCETDLINASNTCAGAQNLGVFCGDGSACGGGIFAINNKGSIWYRVNMNECCTSVFTANDVGIQLTLTVPPGINYDLYLYEGSCGNLVGQSTNAGNATEQIQVCYSDNLASNDSKVFFINVVYSSGSSCQNWTLQGQGCN